MNWQSDYDDVFYVELNGIIAEVSPAGKGEWYWCVFPMGRRCEYPETYNSGVEPSTWSAKLAAEISLVKADEEYGYPFADVQ